MSHFGFMTLYAFLLSLFFATLWRRERKAQVRLFCELFGGLLGGAIALGWLMYFFPAGPPAPIP
jgi:hypothetical protein